MPIVEVENLTVSYSGIKALDSVSLKVHEGDLLGMIGPNGAGKSTMFACMLGLNTRYEGTIRFFGEDIKRSKKYLKQIGYVPQKPVFEKNFPATVREIVSMALDRRSNEKDTEKVLRNLRIHDLRDRRVGELSIGQQQRVFIAKALVNNPKLLILDEPVTGVDHQSSEAFYGILSELNSKQGITIIWSSHDLDAVCKITNCVSCLNKTMSFHGDSGIFFSDANLIKEYSEASMQEHMHRHHA